MQFMIIGCFFIAAILAFLRAVNQPAPPGKHLGWFAVFFLAAAFALEVGYKVYTHAP